MSAVQAVRAAPDLRRAMLAKVHIARKELALDEAAYRAVLARISGVESAAALDAAALDRVLGEFRRLGWQAKRGRTFPARPQARLIRALWQKLLPSLSVGEEGSEAALRAFTARQTGVASPEWLDGVQGNKVVEALKAMLARAKATSA